MTMKFKSNFFKHSSFAYLGFVCFVCFIIMKYDDKNKIIYNPSLESLIITYHFPKKKNDMMMMLRRQMYVYIDVNVEMNERNKRKKLIRQIL